MKSLKKRLLFVFALLLTATIVVNPQVVNANMAAPWQPGDLVGEPTGNFRNLGIILEKLNFDLRPLKDSNSGIVTATYEILNDGDKVSLELLFVSPGIRNSSVTLDGKTVAAVKVKNKSNTSP